MKHFAEIYTFVNDDTPRHLVKFFLHTMQKKSRSATKVDSQFLHGIMQKTDCKNNSYNHQNARSTRHTVKSSQSQLVTTLLYTTVNSSHDFRRF